MPPPKLQHRDPALIADRAVSGGWKSGEHHERDRERAVNLYDEKTLRHQNGALNIYVIWCWEKLGRKEDFEDCKARVLCTGAPIPAMHELKDFWRFYKTQSKGRLGESPTTKSLLSKAKAFKAGFRRLTNSELGDADTEEINRWLRKVLPYEPGSDVHDIEKPKYNLKPLDLDRLIDRLWAGHDLHYTHERNRIQFHLLLLWFCNSGARRGGLFTAGVPYKVRTTAAISLSNADPEEDVSLVLERTAEGKPRFLFKLDQRTVKNNKYQENKRFGVSGREHSILRYDSVFLLLNLAIADGALHPKVLEAMLKNGGDGQVKWNKSARDLPVCRQVDRQGNVHPTKAMTFAVFESIFRGLLLQEGYFEVSVSMHMIRRELGKQLDERYTETERSQHVLHADRRVFGQSYVANVSSCDGFAAFRGEKLDHTAVEYFQGISQFRQPGLPTRLSAAQREGVRRLPEILMYDKEIAQAPDENSRSRVKRERQNALRKAEQTALRRHRQDSLAKLRRERLEGRLSQAPSEDPDPLKALIPERGRIAEKMASTSPASDEVKLEVMRDMLSLLRTSGGVFYRPGEVPKNGKCPYCDTALESIERRKRCKHVHNCRRRAVAERLGVLKSKLKFCFFCMDFLRCDEWEEDYRNHLSTPLKQCGSITYRSTLIRPAFCLLCIQSEHLSPCQRMRSWERDINAIRHMEESHSWPWSCGQCSYSCETEEAGYYHLHDVHGYQLQKKRKYGRTTNPSHAPIPVADTLGTTSPHSTDASTETPDELDDLMSKYLNFPPSPPHTGSPSSDIISTNSPPSFCISPSLLHSSSPPYSDQIIYMANSCVPQRSR
ncbi:hypothetical protein NCS56_00377300 [Fusarium sp. Ph1]|nr:hypothetical protein NCS56_00377300 [Fusarium sp. Ph1]